MYEIGIGKVEMPAYTEGVGMLGFGRPEQRVRGVRMPLHARAFAIRDPSTSSRVVLVSAERLRSLLSHA